MNKNKTNKTNEYKPHVVAWKQFEKTGDISYYLLYKSLIDNIDR